MAGGVTTARALSTTDVFAALCTYVIVAALSLWFPVRLVSFLRRRRYATR